MEFKALQAGLLSSWERYKTKHGLENYSPEYAVMKVGEEYGEFVQAYLIHKKLCKKSKVLPETESKERMSQELSDVVGAAILAAHLLEIDLEEVLDREWIQAD